jgi:hypothetical protein
MVSVNKVIRSKRTLRSSQKGKTAHFDNAHGIKITLHILFILVVLAKGIGHIRTIKGLPQITKPLLQFDDLTRRRLEEAP